MNFTSPAFVLAALLSVMLVSLSDALSSKQLSPIKRTNVVKANPAIKLMANGMTLLKPLFAAEAKLQATLLGSNVVEQEVAQEIAAEVNGGLVVIYTYGLSPFSSEAVNILEKTGCEFKNIEVGAEWFLLNGKESVKRVLLSEFVDNGATSLPKIFVGGKCIGGCAELAECVENGEFESLMTSKGKAKKKLFSFL